MAKRTKSKAKSKAKSEKKQGNPGKWGGKPLDMLESYAEQYLASGKNKKTFWNGFWADWYGKWPPLPNDAPEAEADAEGQTGTNDLAPEELPESENAEGTKQNVDGFELYARTASTEVEFNSFVHLIFNVYILV